MSRYEGKRFKTKYGCLTVLEDNGWDNLIVKFDDGFVTKTSRQMVDKGTIKSPNFPLVAGVGFLGEGKYKPKLLGRVTLEYNTWIGILHRCYDEKRQQKDSSYKDKSVCEAWHNFQNFAEWCQTAKGFGNVGWELDKDLILKGSKIYSPETCAFIPKELNIFLKPNKSKRGKYPLGVTKVISENRYRACICIDGRDKLLGRFNSPEEAFICYKKNKELEIKSKAQKYKNSLDIRVYNSLMVWEISIYD